MLLYNITTQVEHQVHAEWLNWMQQSYIPILMEGGYFEEYRMSRILGIDETDGITYTLQLGVANMPTYRLYQQKQAFQHQSMHDGRYGEKALSFRTVMDVVAKGS